MLVSVFEVCRGAWPRARYLTFSNREATKLLLNTSVCKKLELHENPGAHFLSPGFRFIHKAKVSDDAVWAPFGSTGCFGTTEMDVRELLRYSDSHNRKRRVQGCLTKSPFRSVPMCISQVVEIFSSQAFGIRTAPRAEQPGVVSCAPLQVYTARCKDSEDCAKLMATLQAFLGEQVARDLGRVGWIAKLWDIILEDDYHPQRPEMP